MRLCLFLLFASAAFAQCGPSELLRQLEQLPDLSTEGITYRELVDLHRAFLAKHPGNILAERGLIYVISGGWWAEADRQKELARYRIMPDRKMGRFLEAALQSPDLGVRRLSASFPDLTAQLCVGPIVSIGKLRNPQSRAAAIPEAIGVLGDRTDNKAVIGWSEVIDALHQENAPRLAEAVATLRSLNRYEYTSWAMAVIRGLGYLDHKNEIEQFKAELARRRPDSAWGIESAIHDWKAAHPQPKDTLENGFTQYSREMQAFLRDLQRQHPRSSHAAEYYFASVKYGVSPTLTTDEALTVADLELRYDRDYPFTSFRMNEVPLQAAHAYLAHNARLDEIPNLADEEVRRKRLDYERVRPFPSNAEMANGQLQRAELHADSVLAEYWSHKKDPAQTGAFAERARVILAELVPAPDATGYPRQMFELEQAQWLKTMKAIGLDAKPLAEPRVVNWAQVPRAPFPKFSITDLEGRHWDRTEWKGKVVFLNVWGTWCVPCRAELPNIQKLFEETKDRADLLVLTVNVDEDRELTRKFIADHNYTFPVIASSQFADLVDHSGGLPQTRLIDPESRMLKEPADILCPSCELAVRSTMDRLAAK